ncbi:hypothetical protein HU200_056126 [Digitaria exilis]|uniref:F-box domain-containing protein n=1 Tax=Digitaria exilis TaxID=1010633 RepID=A0A835AG32_9POAL|nr:hypothetical protein HU200_056126 [Digitaria exilis]
MASSPILVSKDDDGEEQTRDWAGLPLDTLLAVLGRLDLADVVLGAGHVCRPWRRAAREEPALWRRIHIGRSSKLGTYYRFEPGARLAVRRTLRWCEAFSADDTNDPPKTIFSNCRAPQLKSLRLTLTPLNVICKQDLNDAISKFTMLEELELSLASDDTALYSSGSLAKTCAVAAVACPLKCFRLNKYRFHWQSQFGDDEAMEIARMPGLRSLQLFGNSLSNASLAAILDGCVSLVSLDIRHCFNVKMNEEMRAKCARLQTLRLPEDSMDDYELSFGCPKMEPDSPGTPGDPDNIGSSWYFR